MFNSAPVPLRIKEGLNDFLRFARLLDRSVTLDNNDYIFAALYGDAKTRGDKGTMKRIAWALMFRTWGRSWSSSRNFL